MKTAFTIFLVSSFAAIAVLGIFVMNHDGENGHVGCLAAASGGNCLAENGGFASIVFHFDAFRNFSTAVVQNQLATALALILLLILIFAVLRNQLLKCVLPVSYIRSRRERSFVPPLRRELTYWLALHENSPAFAYTAPI